jgi:hypothetical protein
MTNRSLDHDLSLSNHLVAEYWKGFQLLQALFEVEYIHNDGRIRAQGWLTRNKS